MPTLDTTRRWQPPPSVIWDCQRANELMRRLFTATDINPALLGGLVLSAGGSDATHTLERHEVAGNLALELGAVELASLDELNDDDPIIVSTSVGAPGLAKPHISLRDYVESARLLAKNIGCQPAGVMCGHVPGLNAWLVAAALNIPLIDVAANGRGHPTVEMGGLGLASRQDLAITQVCYSSSGAGRAAMSVVASGDIIRTSTVMRQCSVENGGLIASARGPLRADFVREKAAAGAISYQLGLGNAMMGGSGSGQVAAVANYLRGRVLIDGTVTANTTAYGGGFDCGALEVTDTNGLKADIGIFNEFMTADIHGSRVATFPDLIASIDPATGDPVAISRLKVGTPVSMIYVPYSEMPVGKGALDAAVFPAVEKAMGRRLYDYVGKS